MEVQKVMDVESLSGVEGSSIDLSEFDKKEVEIEKAEIIQVDSKFTECGKQWVLKVSSVVLTSIEKDGEKIDFRASELFNLIQDQEGKLKGYPMAEGSNLQKFMKDLKVDTPKKLIGKKALVKSYENKEGKIYLRFRY